MGLGSIGSSLRGSGNDGIHFHYSALGKCANE